MPEDYGYQKKYAKKRLSEDEIDPSLSNEEKMRRRALFNRVVGRVDAMQRDDGTGNSPGVGDRLRKIFQSLTGTTGIQQGLDAVEKKSRRQS